MGPPGFSTVPGSALPRHLFDIGLPRLRISPPINSQPRASKRLQASLHLPLIAHLSQAVTLPGRQVQVDLHADEMQEQRHPQRHPKAQAQARSNLFRLVVREACLHDDERVVGRSRLAALRVERSHVLGGSVVDGDQLTAGHGRVVAAGLAGDQRGEDHDQAQGDDGGEVEDGAQHPGAVLVDLETLNVVVRHADAGGRDDGEHADAGLGGQGAAKGASDDHHCTDVAHEGEDDDDVAVDAVDDEAFVAYYG